MTSTDTSREQRKIHRQREKEAAKAAKTLVKAEKVAAKAEKAAKREREAAEAGLDSSEEARARMANKSRKRAEKHALKVSEKKIPTPPGWRP